ncbi:MAG: hypothetical protein OEM32_04925, partial [Acidimicrobiia bacterium]|nr:hypothetical protein [Acidimicrobiia bacterium]
MASPIEGGSGVRTRSSERGIAGPLGQGLDPRCFRLAALILTGCAEPRSEPAPLGTVSLGVDGAFTIAVGAADHIIRDDNGSYFCVLRRP